MFFLLSSFLLSFSSFLIMASLVVLEYYLKSTSRYQLKSALAIAMIQLTLVISPIFCKWFMTSTNSCSMMQSLTDRMMEMAKQLMNSMRLSLEKRLSQMRSVSKRGKSWANRSVTQRKQQQKGLIFSFSSLFQTRGSITTSISLMELSLPQMPFSLLSRSLICSSMMSVMALLYMKKQLASSTSAPPALLAFTMQKMGASISFMPCTYWIFGFSFEQMYSILDMQSQRQHFLCISLLTRKSLYACSSSPQMVLNFYLRGLVKQGIMISGAGTVKNDSSAWVREVSFSICYHREKSSSSSSHRGCFLFMTSGYSGNFSSGRNILTNSWQMLSLFLTLVSHSALFSGRQPRMIFQQYSRRIDASSGMPSARYFLILLVLTTGSLRASMSPSTFLAIICGSPTASKCLRQGNCTYILY